MRRLLALAALAMSVLAPTAFAQSRVRPAPAETLSVVLERCWRAEGIKTSHNSNANFDQEVGHVQAEVRSRWCRTSLEARGPVEGSGKRARLARVDSLTLRLWTDTITAELHERASEPPRLVVNGRAASAEWWLARSRERVLRLARPPLP